jgi:hypothetical protein
MAPGAVTAPPEPIAAAAELEAAEPPAAGVEDAAASAPQPVTDLAVGLARQSPGRTAAESLAALLAAWSFAPPDPAPEFLALEDVLAELEARGLAVVPLAGVGLDVVRALGHPALLLLVAADGVPRAVALRRIDDLHADVYGLGLAAGAAARVEVAALASAWSGEAYVVWRDMEPLPALLRLGDGGEAVAWLQRALGELGFHAASPSGRFDEPTELAVRAFQAWRSLIPDGQVGPLTKMSLYDALERYAVPRLSMPAAAGPGVG